MIRSIVSAFLILASTAILSAQTATPSFELNRDVALSNTDYSTSSSAIVSGDFNNDGKPDILIGGGATSTTLTLRLGNGDGTFQPPIPIGQSQNGYISDMAVADVNNDGNLDLIVASLGNTGNLNGVFQVFLGNGNGSFQPPSTYTPKFGPLSIAVGDFNGDGQPDIAAGDQYGGTVEIWNNTGGASFALANTLTPGNTSSAIKVRAGQFNGDGINHLVAELSGSSIYALWNDGHENFTPVLLTSYPYISDINTGDLNLDGKSDILISYQCNPDYSNDTQCGGIEVYYGEGNNVMTGRTAVTMPNVLTHSGSGNDSPVALWAVDVNGDGIGDIAAEPPAAGGNIDDAPSGLYVWLGNPDGSFSQTALNYLPTHHGAGSLVPGDFNRDGMMDFAQTLPFDQETEIFINGGAHAPCSKYTISPSVTVCQPVDHTYLPAGPVTVQASAVDTHTVTAMQEYVDYKLDYSQSVTSFSQSFPLTAGNHLLVTKAWDATGYDFISPRTLTVYNGTPGPACPVAAVNSAAICLPAGATSSTPVQILANGWTSNVPTAAQLYIDNQLVLTNQACNGNNCDGGTSYLNATQGLAAGSHDLVFKLWDDQGNAYSAQKTINVQ